ncbi:hypothetical protein FHR87_000654 [Azomonas macrocytogenes]|uniref:Uncharacterized protein n=1 Tax=Azomonas macrocytogenes TaxID=69962 RepID=A0A839SY45_AZOMA|nr:hypothetical protein [Azomonas macrocytogenes]
MLEKIVPKDGSKKIQPIDTLSRQVTGQHPIKTHFESDRTKLLDQ